MTVLQEKMLSSTCTLCFQFIKKTSSSLPLWAHLNVGQRSEASLAVNFWIPEPIWPHQLPVGHGNLPTLTYSLPYCIPLPKDFLLSLWWHTLQGCSYTFLEPVAKGPATSESVGIMFLCNATPNYPIPPEGEWDFVFVWFHVPYYYSSSSSS